MVDIIVCVAPIHPLRISAEKSLRDGARGNSARDNVNDENAGGLVDGNTQLPIFNGAVVDINNSPETVKPKFS